MRGFIRQVCRCSPAGVTPPQGRLIATSKDHANAPKSNPNPTPVPVRGRGESIVKSHSLYLAPTHPVLVDGVRRVSASLTARCYTAAKYSIHSDHIRPATALANPAASTLTRIDCSARSSGRRGRVPQKRAVASPPRRFQDSLLSGHSSSVSKNLMTDVTSMRPITALIRLY